MTTTKPRVQNITRAFRAASTADRAEGLFWYNRAWNLALELDPINPKRAVAVMAVLSPRVRWDRNMYLARKAYAMHGAAFLHSSWGMPNPFRSPQMFSVGFGCLGNSAQKAFRILAGEDIFTVMSGEKVNAFYNNICGDDDYVTVDRHAIDIAVGKVLDDNARAKAIAGKDGYSTVAKMYVSAAKILSREYGFYITPPQVQAVTWVYWRRNKGVA